MLPLGAACAAIPNSTVIATSGVPSVSTASPTQQNAPVGSTIEATTESLSASGGTVTGRAAYTVTNLHPTTAAHEYTEVKGTLYSVDVTVQVETGVVVVHPWFFAARTEDGTNMTAELGALDNELPATDLPQGQKVRGPIAFDVPRGKNITEIVLTDGMGGPQRGRWTVG